MIYSLQWEYRNIARNCNIQNKEENITGFLRSKYVPSRSSSRASDDDERYETADSGWSSDGVSKLAENICLAFISFNSPGSLEKILQITELFQEMPAASKASKHSEPISNDQLTQIPDHPVNQQESAEADQRNETLFLFFTL